MYLDEWRGKRESERGREKERENAVSLSLNFAARLFFVFIL